MTFLALKLIQHVIALVSYFEAKLKETHSFAPSFNLRRANVRRAKLRRASGDPPSFSDDISKKTRFAIKTKIEKLAGVMLKNCQFLSFSRY